MTRHKINIHAIALIAKALAELKDKIVFVGGAVISLYANTESDEEVRETFDIDITSIEVVNYNKYCQLLNRLYELGFYPDSESKVICRLRYKGIQVDVMTPEEIGIGPTNKWYKGGFKDLIKKDVEGEEIQILSSPYYLATKFEAFNNRGKDYRSSHDFEDIIYVLDNRKVVVDEIKSSDRTIQQFLINEFQKIDSNIYAEEILTMHLSPNTVEERFPIIKEKIKQIVNL